MPEGPEIWRISDQLANILIDRKVTKISFAFNRLKKFENLLVNKEIKGVEPRGKALLINFGNGLNIYSHLQLYGKWLLVQKGQRPDTNRKLRLAIHNNEYSALLYSASDINVLDKKRMKSHAYLKKLGPDVLHPETTFQEVLDRFNGEAFKNRKLTTLLLDQGFLSGIGNYLRSEILFYAGIHPDLKLRMCSEKQKRNLSDAALELSRRSYETGGITTDPEVVDALKREGKNRHDYRHFVYGRGDEPCHKCGSVVAVDKTGGRKVYYCPGCQKN